MLRSVCDSCTFLCVLTVGEGGSVILLSKLLDWYKRDFGDGTDKGMLAAIARWLPEEEGRKLTALLQDPSWEPRVQFTSYDWSLNSI